ncbi:hypothetical protein [Streptomyces telluris]|uniref:LRV domain-containing protein n=2 Tax=Streptomyces telluris TaxID=2720021 RepID=A0A9X2LRZ1_9ACTN|nr:hypothetical protein [Streptomyces telluris]MCQ8774530.1 hypothetical protein [Streptomyces telluris]
MSADILYGLAGNPAAPPDVLLRLLHSASPEVGERVARRASLPGEVIDAIVGHPDVKVRSAFAESPLAPGAQRARLVDDTPRVRLALATGPLVFRSRPEPLPDETYARLFNDPRSYIRHEALISPSLPARVLAGLAGSPDPDLRHAACRAWDELTPEAREALLADEEPYVRRAAALRAASGDARHTAELAGELDRWDLTLLLTHGRLDRVLAERYAHSDEPSERMAVAENPSLPADLVAHLARDPHHPVRRAVSARPELTETQRAAIDYEIGPDERLRPLLWVREAREDAGVLRRCVHSSHVWLRRSAAVSPYLPPDLVARLARDDDFAVRLLLCEHHPAPPPELMWRILIEWDGCTRWLLLDKPGFPLHRLAALADHEDPGLRRFAVHAPDASPGLLDRLSRDEADYVRHQAAGDPRLPLPRLHEMLADPADARYAAQNPGLSPAGMRRLLDEAVVV